MNDKRQTVDRVYRLIRLNRRIRSHRIKFVALAASHVLGIRHLSVRLDPIIACNLRCRMCHFSGPGAAAHQAGSFTPDEIQRLAGMFLPRALQLVIGCWAEPTLYRGFAELVKLGKDYGVPSVGLTTNGQLLTAETLETLYAYGLDELTLSTHGVKRETYEYFMVRASYDKLHQVLQALEKMKQRHASDLPHLRLNYTANPDNLPELANFFDMYGDYTIQTLQVRPVMDIAGEYRRPMQPEDVRRYNATINKLAETCRQRGTVLLANVIDPTYHGRNYASVVFDAVYRHITPSRVWRDDFDWRHETYNDYCRRTHWTRQLLASAGKSAETLVEHNPFSRNLTYDVKP
jgi:molybdenum cofactor biosynthesis enzyme MoaA